ncbi:MAG: GNAT family N-acetyltransferase [Verrucomicrobia bacterium]|nr:GNAT family N-acetyltransferase [Verrucomicrobiota bacterium]MBU6446298.1 GNAT family N-acetyltransferase [Verrucomicrobiota bacterium]MDE3047191.1 GNAT family N-acetyltransferase [Verrucomicrobiota bacterium]
MTEVKISNHPPTPEEFVSLREAVKLPPRTVASARKGIPNSLFWVTVREGKKLVGMGRVVGDGGSVVQITDVIVDPEHQEQGIAALIFDRIQSFIQANVPHDAFVCLFATKDAISFYETKGFRLSQEQWPGMFWPSADRKTKS